MKRVRPIDQKGTLTEFLIAPSKFTGIKYVTEVAQSKAITFLAINAFLIAFRSADYQSRSICQVIINTCN